MNDEELNKIIEQKLKENKHKSHKLFSNPKFTENMIYGLGLTLLLSLFGSVLLMGGWENANITIEQQEKKINNLLGELKQEQILHSNTLDNFPCNDLKVILGLDEYQNYHDKLYKKYHLNC